MQNTNYRNTFGISQSSIKDFRYMTPAQWRQKYLLSQTDLDREGEHLDYGSLLDTLLFTPELLKNRFYVAAEGMKVPSESIKKILDTVYEEYCKGDIDDVLTRIGAVTTNYKLDDLKEEMINIAKRPEHNYGKGSYKDERIVKELTEKGEEYFELLKTIGDKVVITTEDNMRAVQQKEQLTTHPRTRPWFIQQEGETLLFQKELFVDLRRFDLPMPALIEAGSADPTLVQKKSALDIVRINHFDKTIQNADFKTSFDAHNFLGSIKKYGYAAQLSFYDIVLRQWATENYPEYEVLEPINIVADKKIDEPYIYQFNAQDLETEKTGYDFGKDKKTGWETVMNEILWHLETNIWSKRDLHLNNHIKVKLYS